jgi:hypothetical protein
MSTDYEHGRFRQEKGDDGLYRHSPDRGHFTAAAGGRGSNALGPALEATHRKAVTIYVPFWWRGMLLIRPLAVGILTRLKS